MTQVYVVAPNWGEYEGWRAPVGAYSTETLAQAAIGRAVLDGQHYAQQLRVVPLIVDAPLEAAAVPASGGGSS